MTLLAGPSGPAKAGWPAGPVNCYARDGCRVIPSTRSYDMSFMTRRRFLENSAAGIAAAAATRVLPVSPARSGTQASAAGALPRYVGPGSTAPVRPFQLSDVRLGAGLFQEKQIGRAHV